MQKADDHRSSETVGIRCRQSIIIPKPFLCEVQVVETVIERCHDRCGEIQRGNDDDGDGCRNGGLAEIGRIIRCL